MAEKTYPEQLLRLKEEHQKALQETDDQINQWMKFRSDYDALKKRLYTLPDQVSHDVMVPFGKMAFMPGQLVHTNEILVLLGDNWFVERSAKQAAEIIDRRIKAVDKQLDELKSQRQLLEPRQQFTAQLQEMSKKLELEALMMVEKEGGEIMEIREEYDEEKERQWKEAHRKHVKEYRSRLKREAVKQESSQQDTRKSNVTDEELWARLDQLESIENERKEMLKIGTEAEKKLEGYDFPVFQCSGGKSQMVDNKVAESDHTDTEDEESSYTASDELDSDDEEDVAEETGDVEEQIVSKGTVITFSHSKNEVAFKSSDLNCATEDISVINPGDIYTRYIKALKPKSILKKDTSEQKKKVRHKTRKPVVAFDTGSEDERDKRRDCPGNISLEPAFSGTVVEKPMADLSPQKQEVVSQRPVSKFKARAANQNKGFTGMTNQKDPPSEKPVSKFKAQRQMINR